jgi:hypothetical protein
MNNNNNINNDHFAPPSQPPPPPAPQPKRKTTLKINQMKFFNDYNYNNSYLYLQQQQQQQNLNCSNQIEQSNMNNLQNEPQNTASNNLSSSPTSSSTLSTPTAKKPTTKTATRQKFASQQNIASSQNNKKYQKFKKIFEKQSAQKRHAQNSTIQARNHAAKLQQDQERHDAELDEIAKQFSKETLREKLNFFEKNLSELNSKLEFVRHSTRNSLNSFPIDENSNENDAEFRTEYAGQLRKLDAQADEKLKTLQFWNEKQRNEIDHQYRIEQKQSIKEYDKKRADLKRKLKNKYEEMRKQLELDQALLDINMDMNEINKLPRTRNLRKRINHNNMYLNNSMHNAALLCNLDYSIDWLNLDFNASLKSKHLISHLNHSSKASLLVDNNNNTIVENKPTCSKNSTTTQVIENLEISISIDSSSSLKI